MVTAGQAPSDDTYIDIFNAPPLVWSLLALGYIPLFAASAALWYQRHCDQAGADKSDLLLNRRFFYSLISVGAFTRAVGCIFLGFFSAGVPDVLLLLLLTTPSLICTSIESLLVFFWAKLYYTVYIPKSLSSPALHPSASCSNSALSRQESLPFQDNTICTAVTPKSPTRRSLPFPRGDICIMQKDNHVSRSLESHDLEAKYGVAPDGRTSITQDQASFGSNRKAPVMYFTLASRQPVFVASFQSNVTPRQNSPSMSPSSADDRVRSKNTCDHEMLETMSQESGSAEDIRASRSSLLSEGPTFKRPFAAPVLQQQAHHHPTYVMLNSIMYALWASSLLVFGLAWPIDSTILFVGVFGIISTFFLACFVLFLFYGISLRRVLNLSGSQKSQSTLVKVASMTAICTVCFSIRSLLTVMQLCEARIVVQFKPVFHFVYFGAFDMAPLAALLISLHYLSAKRRASSNPRTESTGLLASPLRAHNQYEALTGASCPTIYAGAPPRL